MAEPLLDKEIAVYLKAQGFGDLYSDPGRKQKIFVGEQPAKDPTGTSVTVLEGGGGPAEVVGLVEVRAFTLLTRGPAYEDTKARAQQLNRALSNQQGILSNIVVDRIRPDTNPIHLGKNPNQLHEFTQSFTLRLKRIVPTTGVDFEPQP